MDPRCLLATIGIVTLAVFASASVLVENDDTGSSDTCKITFNANGGSGGYSIDVLNGTSYYLPTESMADCVRNGYVLAGWTCNGQFYDIGSKMICDGTERTYDAAWISGSSTHYSITESSDWSKTYYRSDYTKHECEDVNIKSPTVTVTDYLGNRFTNATVTSDSDTAHKNDSCTIKVSLNSNVPRTYIVSVSYEVDYCYLFYSGDSYLPAHEVSEQKKSETFIVTFEDPSVTAMKKIIWQVEGQQDIERYGIIGDTFEIPYAGTLPGTEDLAWWTADYYGTGDIYFIPGTSIPVEEGKNLTFKAKMHEAGQGAIGFDFRGGQSSTVQIANIYDIGSEIVLPSDVRLNGYHLAGWIAGFEPSVLYLPGTVLGPEISGIIAANTDTNYIEMRAVWVKDSEPHHFVTFQNNDGACVSSEYVPHGMKVFLPIYGFDSLSGRLEKWAVGGNEYDPGMTVVADSNLLFDAKYPVPASPFDTCTVVFLVGDAQTNLASVVLNNGDSLILPKVDKAYHVFCYWYEANGTIWQSGDIVHTNLLLNAKWERIFDMETEGNTVTLDVKAGYDYEISWGDGTYGAENSRSHTYPDNSRGKLTVKMLDGDYAGQTAWAIYQIGSVTTVDPIDPVPVPNPEPQPMPEPRPEPDPEKDDLTVYYIVGGAIAAIFGLIIARRFI